MSLGDDLTDLRPISKHVAVSSIVPNTLSWFDKDVIKLRNKKCEQGRP